MNLLSSRKIEKKILNIIYTMSTCTTYHPFKIALTDGQKKKLQKAYVTKAPVNLKVKPDQIGRGVELLLTETQIAQLKKLNGNKIKPDTDSKYFSEWKRYANATTTATTMNKTITTNTKR